MSATITACKRCSVTLYLQLFVCSVTLYLQLFVGGFISYLRCLCSFAHSGVQHILCCVHYLFVFRLVACVASFSGSLCICLPSCGLCCQFLWFIIYLSSVLWPVLPVSLECPFLIAPLVYLSYFKYRCYNNV